MRHLRCRYHGWTYDWNGELASGPELDAMVDFERSAVRLPSIDVAVWQGLVFASVQPQEPFERLIAGVDERIGSALQGIRYQKRVSYEAACNWKAYVDNYLEGYHVPHIHPALNRLLDYRAYRTECEPGYALQSSPLDVSESFYGAGEALYYQLWPNTMLNILPGRLQTNRVVPLAVDRCRIDFDYYYTPQLLAADADKIVADQALAEVTQQEDIDICEQVQRAFASGSYDTGRVHPTREQGVHWFQERYRRTLSG
jgi:choline monooxygenase